jgi:hypothetical protein
MGNTLSIFFSETVQLIGTNLGHNIPLVDHTNQYIPTIMTIFGLKVLLTDVVIVPRLAIQAPGSL